MSLNEKAARRFSKKGKTGLTGSAGKSFVLHTGNAFSGGDSDFDYTQTGRKTFLSALIAIAAIVVQEGIFNDLRVFGAKPKILLAVLVLISMSSDMTFSLFLGFFSGLAVDVTFGRYLGFYALTLMYFCFITSVLVRPLFKGKYLFYITAGPYFIFSYTLISGFLARFLALYASRSPSLYGDFAGHLVKRIIPESVYTYIVFAVLVFPVTLALKKTGRDRRKKIDFK